MALNTVFVDEWCTCLDDVVTDVRHDILITGDLKFHLDD